MVSRRHLLLPPSAAVMLGGLVAANPVCELVACGVMVSGVRITVRSTRCTPYRRFGYFVQSVVAGSSTGRLW